jgi:hypothetical protein
MERPGKQPEVRKEGDALTFVLQIALEGSRRSAELVIRCERNGEISASIRNS